MAKTLPLDEQIIAVLTQPCQSDEAQSVLDAALAALRDLSAKADAADVASLNPLASAREAMAHRARAGDLRFESDRLDASVSALRERVDELQDAEDRARRAADRAAVQARFDRLAADIARQYPRIVREMTQLVRRIEENEAECKRVGIHDSAERVGRGWNPSTAGTPMHSLTQVILPLPADSWGRPAWGFGGAYGGTRTWDGLDLPQAEAEGETA